MKRFIPAILSFVLCIGSFILPAFAKNDLIEVSQNMPFAMTVLGDSIPAGFGLEGYKGDPCYNCKSYPNILAEKYGLKANNNYHNLAVSGATSADLLNLLQNEKTSNQLKYSDTIIISIGGNDILHVLYNALGEGLGNSISDISSIEDLISSVGLPQLMKISKYIEENMPIALEGFAYNLDSIVDSIKAVNPEALIIVQTIYNPFESFEQLEAIQELSVSTVADFNKIIADSATDEDGNKRYLVSDIAAEFKGKANALTNIGKYDIHPNTDGHKAIAETLDEEISKHTFTTWIINTSASADSEAKSDAKRYLNVMTGFFYMLIFVVIMLAVIFIKKMREL